MPYAYLMNPKMNEGDCWVFKPRLAAPPPRDRVEQQALQNTHRRQIVFRRHAYAFVHQAYAQAVVDIGFVVEAGEQVDHVARHRGAQAGQGVGVADDQRDLVNGGLLQIELGDDRIDVVQDELPAAGQQFGIVCRELKQLLTTGYLDLVYIHLR